LPQGPLSRKRGRSLKNAKNRPVSRAGAAKWRKFAKIRIILAGTGKARGASGNRRLHQGRTKHIMSSRQQFRPASAAARFGRPAFWQWQKANRFTMQDDDGQRERGTGAFAKNPGKGARQDPRQDRLKLALRENLKRRKSQARGRGDPASSKRDDVSPYDDGAGKPGK
jgi:hypothetical protein